MRNRRARLLVFLAVSLAAHALVLLRGSAPPDARAPRDSADMILTVSFLGESPARARLPRVAKDTHAAARDTSRATSAPPNVFAFIPRPQSARGESHEGVRYPTDELAPNSSTGEQLRRETLAEAQLTRDARRAWLRLRVAEALNRYFTYPLLARQHNFEGTVILTYRIEADGRLDGIAVARSSGYALLDRAAVADLRRVPPLADAVSSLHGGAMEDKLPVIYRLRDN